MQHLKILAICTLFAALSGCSGMKPPTAAQCGALLAAASDETLNAQCAVAKDPIKDPTCITLSTLRTAYAVCLSQVPPPAAL